MSNDTIIRRQTTNQFFVHNVFGNFFRGVLDWFGDDFYPRFNYKIIGTYDKAVEFFNKKKQLGHEVDTNLLPSITLDPNLDFSPEERAGRFLWQYATLAPGLGFRVNNYIDLKEQDITITPVFTRYQGTFELIFWMSSVYELLDFRTMLLQFCGGFGRWIRPKYFWSYIILPDEIEQFKNDKNIPIDWGNTDCTIILIDTIKKYKRAVPLALDAIWKLDSLNDNSTKYGGDNIAEYKLSATFTYECNIPTYMVVNTKVDPTLVLGFSIGKVFTKYPLASPIKILQKTAEVDHDISLLVNKSMNFYRINVKQSDEIKFVEFNKEILIYPKKEDFISWCPISKGKLTHVKEGMKYDDVQKGDIIFFEVYREEYLPFIRKCSSVICHHGRIESPLFAKCEILKKSLISDLNDWEYDKVRQYEGLEITLDVLERKMYSGLLEIEQIGSSDVSGIGYDQLKSIKEKDPEIYNKAISKLNESDKYFFEHVLQCYLDQLNKHLITDYSDGIEKNYPLGFHVSKKLKDKVKIYLNNQIVKNSGLLQYTINTSTDILSFIIAPEKGSVIHSALETIPIKDAVLLLTYNFTSEDLKRKSDEYIEISLDFQKEGFDKVESVYDLFLGSYCGILEYEKDYIIDFVKNIVVIKIKPKEDESVLIYQALFN